MCLKPGSFYKIAVYSKKCIIRFYGFIKNKRIPLKKKNASNMLFFEHFFLTNSDMKLFSKNFYC